MTWQLVQRHAVAMYVRSFIFVNSYCRGCTNARVLAPVLHLLNCEPHGVAVHGSCQLCTWQLSAA
jgi:hypothetical protein